jgi:hypothetical protein
MSPKFPSEIERELEISLISIGASNLLLCVGGGVKDTYNAKRLTNRIISAQNNHSSVYECKDKDRLLLGMFPAIG